MIYEKFRKSPRTKNIARVADLPGGCAFVESSAQNRMFDYFLNVCKVGGSLIFIGISF